jgi:hypothetical protein
MKRVTWKWIAISVLALGAAACANEGVGDPCVPENIPCENPETNEGCGYGPTESYIESSSAQCRSRVCVVHKLSGGPAGLALDPRDICDRDEGRPYNPSVPGKPYDSPGCVTQAQIDESIYCSCRCRDGDNNKVEGCECADGFRCEEILTLGGDGIRGSYCVRPKAM